MTLEEQIKALKKYDRVEIKLRDIDMVRPSSRGKTIQCTFINTEHNTHEGLIVWCEGNNEAIEILGHSIPYSSTPKLGFHEWLIESLTVIE